MRKGQRFTPARLERWSRAGRGSGAGADYRPWHQVTRDDPGSRGRSHLVSWRFGRLHHLLSDQELVAFGFASMLPGLADVREQFALAIDDQVVEGSWHGFDSGESQPGTLTLAKVLGVKHPTVRRAGETCPWVMSTDLLLTVQAPQGKQELLAISVKHQDELLNRRKGELLRLEQAYWHSRKVPWLLLTPTLHDPGVAMAVRMGLPWAIGDAAVDGRLIARCAALAPDIQGRSMRQALPLIGSALALDTSAAQTVLWQSVWCAQLPLNLARPLRPDQPLELMSQDAFWRQNPIASRRSAWTH